jgi:hypothetical protein
VGGAAAATEFLEPLRATIVLPPKPAKAPKVGGAAKGKGKGGASSSSSSADPASWPGGAGGGEDGAGVASSSADGVASSSSGQSPEEKAADAADLLDLYGGMTDEERAQVEAKNAQPVSAAPWSPAEDEQLIQLVSKLGEAKFWHKLALYMPGRDAAACLERWREHLNPTVRKGLWTPEEDALIATYRLEIGNRVSGAPGWGGVGGGGWGVGGG